MRFRVDSGDSVNTKGDGAGAQVVGNNPGCNDSVIVHCERYCLLTFGAWCSTHDNIRVTLMERVILPIDFRFCCLVRSDFPETGS